MIRAALLLAASIASSCSRAVPPESPSIELSADRPSAPVPLPAGHGGRIMLEITPWQRTAKGPVTVAIATEGGPTTRISLYPSDRPGRFALRVPPSARAATMSIDSGGAMPNLTVRVLPLHE
jgi:hypothetical protein